MSPPHNVKYKRRSNLFAKYTCQFEKCIFKLTFLFFKNLQKSMFFFLKAEILKIFKLFSHFGSHSPPFFWLVYRGFFFLSFFTSFLPNTMQNIFSERRTKIVEEKFYKRYKDLPLFLNAQDLKNLFGISLTAVYSLLHQKFFLKNTDGADLKSAQTPTKRPKNCKIHLILSIALLISGKRQRNSPLLPAVCPFQREMEKVYEMHRDTLKSAFVKRSERNGLRCKEEV